MKRVLFALGLTVLMTGTVTAENVVLQTVTEVTAGKENIVEREISVKNFSSIDACLGMRVTYSVGSRPSCRVSAPARVYEYLDIHVDGQTLVTGVKPKDGRESLDRKEADLLKEVIITVISPRLTEVEASTGASVTLKGAFKTDGKIELEASTGAAITFRNITVEEVEADVSTGARIVVSGTAVKADLDASTGANIEASGLQVKQGSADASTGASVSVSQKSVYNCSKSTGGSIR